LPRHSDEGFYDYASRGKGLILAHKKLIAVILVSVIGASIFVSAVPQRRLSAPVIPTAPSTSYAIGQQGWTMQAVLDGAQFGSVTYMIPSSVDTGNLPVYVVGTPTSTSLIVDPDMVNPTPVPQWGCMKFGDALSFTSTYGGFDGMLPQVSTGLSLVWMTDKNGNPTGSPVPDSTGVDSQGRYWERYYMMVQVFAGTQIHPTSTLIGTGDPTGYCAVINGEETAPEHVVLWVRLILTNPVSNNSFTATFDSAEVVAPPQTTGNAIMAGGNPFTYYLSSKYSSIVSGDDAASPTFDLVGKQALSPIYMAGQSIGQGGGSYDLQVSGTLQAGGVWNHGLGNMKLSWNAPVDVLWTCCILTSVIVTSKNGYVNPNQGNIFAQFLEFFQNAFTALNMPGFPWGTLVGVIIAVVLAYIFVKFLGRKRKQDTNINIIVGGQDETATQEPERLKRAKVSRLRREAKEVAAK
jgi:hypothetical protein